MAPNASPPQPATSTLTNGGVAYTFAADGTGPVIVENAFSPSFPGRQPFNMNLAGGPAVNETAFVMP